MTPERFAAIERVFAEAVALPPAQRADLLARQCAGDPELRAEVESLLASDAQAGARLAGTIEQAAASLPAQDPDVGLRLGPYLLVREIGRGGMGAVYLAVRSDGEYLHTVAVKLVKRGMDSDAILQRFRAERQILAGLSHPHIGGLLDGGTSPDGRPYLVMEYIEGESIVAYAESRQLDVRARLELFRPICLAVDYAHRRHVLHRDIKPANVMVTAEGTPKLLDFGIAKLLLPELVAGGLPPTETQARLMTPDYASPEQIRGEELTCATDVYSLGVLLYRLLAGKQPYAITGRSMSEIERAITEQTAPLPSRAAADPRLRSVLSGDLDTIISMAMRKEPERRYASAGDLEADLARYLCGERVLARPDSWPYRARRWTRRHGLAAAATAAIGVLGTAAAGQYYLRRASYVPPEALDLCRRAELLLRTDIRTTHPGQGMPAPLREAITLYTRATETAPRHVPAWTGLAAAAEFSIDYDQPHAPDLRRLAERAAAQALQLDPNSAPARATRGALLYRAWKFSEAAAEFARSVALDPYQPYVVADLADCLNLSGRPAEALATLEQGLRDTIRGQATHGPNVRAEVVVLSALAVQYRSMKQFDRAADHARHAVRLQGNYAPARLQLGLILQQTGDTGGAAREFQTAFAMWPGDQRAAAALGHLHAVQGRRREALKMLAHLKTLPSEGASVHGSVALVKAGLGDRRGALESLAAAVRVHEAGTPYRFFDFRLRDVLAQPEAAALAAKLGLQPAP